MKLHADHFLDRLNRGGVLLTTKTNEKTNTMTIGWGSVSEYWGKNVLIVPVRQSRYTHEMLEKSESFSVSVPRYNEIAKEIAYCGTNSGRDVDKFAKCNFTAKPAKSISTPIVREAYLHYECKIIAKIDMTVDHIEKELAQNWYSTNDYHTLYFGEILECYITG